jgi:hypothetical protein
MLNNMLILILAFSLLGSSSFAETTWYRGNTHVHTELCGHADSHPDVVAKWYLDQGYNFLVLSEHNKFIDPATVNLPKGSRKDFVLIPGEEVTGKKTIHTTAINIKKLVPWKFDDKDKTKIVQNHVDGIRKEGGHAILNHPNFHHTLNYAHISKVKNLYMFELYNGHPSVNTFGDKKSESTEKLWDKLLTSGMLIYGVSSDDAHHIEKWSAQKSKHFKKWGTKRSNPGRGWVMVNSNKKLTPDAITDAMVHGEFYSSNGVFLKQLQKSTEKYELEIDDVLTKKEITKKFVVGFIGDAGKVLNSVSGLKASFTPPAGLKYLRAKVTLTVKENDTLKQYYAWAQPVFFDKRSH